MTDNSNRKTFLRRATAFKNALDMTREYRDDAIAHANETVCRVEELHNVPDNGAEL
jgi:hypothetical protein